MISDRMGAEGLNFGHQRHASVMSITNDNLALSQQEGSGTFWMVKGILLMGGGGAKMQPPPPDLSFWRSAES